MNPSDAFKPEAGGTRLPATLQQGLPPQPLPRNVPLMTASTPRLLGDWLGARTWLTDRGVTPSITYLSETSANLNGGRSRKARYADQWAFAATGSAPNLLGGEKPAAVQLTVTYRSGQSINDENGLGIYQPLAEIFGRGTVWRLTQAWYRAGIGPWDAKLGRMTVGEDFASAGCEFQTLYFCGATPGQIAPNYWHNYPVSQWGMRVRRNLGKSGFVQTGVYQVSPRNTDPTDGFNLEFSGTKGVMVPIEADWTPTIGRGKLPGSYKVGIWFTTSNEPDVVLNRDGRPRLIAGGLPLMRHDAAGVYANVRQTISSGRQDGSGAVSFFANAAFMDGRTTRYESKVTFGAILSGPFARRPKDEAGIALGSVKLNRRITEVTILQNASREHPLPVQRAEYASEIYYSFQPVGGIILRPNIQYIHHPSGIADRSGIVLLGMRVIGNF